MKNLHIMQWSLHDIQKGSGKNQMVLNREIIYLFLTKITLEKCSASTRS